jgi:hypothetical protein
MPYDPAPQEFDPTIEAILNTVADRLRLARRALFITGAGISADSGLPKGTLEVNHIGQSGLMQHRIVPGRYRPALRGK